MAKIKIYQIRRAGVLPADCPLTLRPMNRFQSVALEPEERQVLEAAGVPAEWIKEAGDGSVWAGGELEPGKLIAKVRGKGGRRLGQGRFHEPLPESRKVTSVSFAPNVKAHLEARVAEGKAPTLSAYLEGLVLADMGLAVPRA